MSDSAPIQQLKERLAQLEQTLAKIAGGMEEDLEVARALQKQLMPNRTREIPGLTSHARYVSAQQIASESFDLIPTKDHRELWIIAAWTESFGLSSVLLQALVHLQSRALVESRAKLTPAEAFNEISTALVDAKKRGGYRLMVARLNVATLEMSGCAVGMPPWIRRARQGASFGPWELAQAEALRAQPELFEPASSAAPRLADQAYNFSFHLTPGTRLHFLSPGWNPDARVDEFLAPLRLVEQKPAGQDLLGEMNLLHLGAQAQLKAQGREADVTTLSFEVDARKLHIA